MFQVILSYMIRLLVNKTQTSKVRNYIYKIIVGSGFLFPSSSKYGTRANFARSESLFFRKHSINPFNWFCRSGFWYTSNLNMCRSSENRKFCTFLEIVTRWPNVFAAYNFFLFPLKDTRVLKFHSNSVTYVAWTLRDKRCLRFLENSR